jgi:hypothetical protein
MIGQDEGKIKVGVCSLCGIPMRWPEQRGGREFKVWCSNSSQG